MDIPDFGEKFFTKKNIVTLLLIGIMLLVIPVGVKMLQEQQLLKIRATGEEITFIADEEGNVQCDDQGKCTTKTANIQIELRSPFGPPGTVEFNAPTSLSQSCSADGKNITFAWTPPNSGTAPTGYTLRVDKEKDVWAPEACDAKTSPCQGKEGSGDFIPPNVTGASYTALIVPGQNYGWSLQAIPNSNPFDKRTDGGSFSCSITGEKTQISQPATGGDGAPTGLGVSCAAGNQTAVSATFAWTPPNSGTSPTGYALRVNKEQDVWAPETCDAKTAPCTGKEGSGDFIPPAFNSTNYIAAINPGAKYGWSIQAVPNTGSFDRRTDGGSFTCQGEPGR